jgi:hypothetical protein
MRRKHDSELMEQAYQAWCAIAALSPSDNRPPSGLRVEELEHALSHVGNIIENLPAIVEWLFLYRLMLRDGTSPTWPPSADLVADTESNNEVLYSLQTFAAGARVLRSLLSSVWLDSSLCDEVTEADG